MYRGFIFENSRPFLGPLRVYFQAPWYPEEKRGSRARRPNLQGFSWKFPGEGGYYPA